MKFLISLDISVFSKMGDFIKNIAGLIDLEAVTTSLISTIFTGFLGFVTFKVYQRYRNRKDINLLYVLSLRLYRSLEEDMNKIQNLKNEVEELKFLKLDFMRFSNANLNKFYSKIMNLRNFYDEDQMKDQYGNVIDVEYNYYEHPYFMIQQLHYDLHNMNSDGGYSDNDLNRIENEIAELQGLSIFDEFDYILKLIAKIDDPLTEEHMAAIEYINIELEKFSSLETGKKRRMLNKFCCELLDEKNNLSLMLNKYDKIMKLEKKYKKPINIRSNNKNYVEFDFKIWQEENINLLAENNVETYIKMDNFYKKFKSSKLYYWDIGSIDEVKKNSLDPLAIELKKYISSLEKSIKKNYRYFGNL